MLSCYKPRTIFSIATGIYTVYTHIQSPLIRLDGLHPHRSFSALTSAPTYVLLFGLLFLLLAMAMGNGGGGGSGGRGWLRYC